MTASSERNTAMTELACLGAAPELAAALAQHGGLRRLDVGHDHYPDGESRFLVERDIAGAHIGLLANLHRPDEHTLPLLLLADTLRDLGAARLSLVAPYLPYMRQDKRFRDGEGITSRYYATLLSRHIDHLVTVDPHLHRYHSLDEIYSVPSTVLHAAPVLAQWVAANVRQPLLVGPDEESEQWVGEVARDAGAPFVVAEKIRSGDRSVQVRLPDVSRWAGHQPVLVDDIISSGRTMLEAIRALRSAGLPAAVCVGVHAVFGDADYRALAAEAAAVVTTDAIPHPSNRISLAPLLAGALG